MDKVMEILNGINFETVIGSLAGIFEQFHFNDLLDAILASLTALFAGFGA